MILGIDISSSITGIAVIENGEVLYSDICDTRNKKKFPHVNDAAITFRHILEVLSEKYNITDVYVETPLLAFMKARSSAKTLATLTAYNCLYCFLIEEVFGIRPNMIAAVTARKQSGVSKFKDKEKDTKQWVLEGVESLVSDFSYKLTSHGNPTPGTYDRADAIVVALAGEVLCNIESSKS